MKNKLLLFLLFHLLLVNKLNAENLANVVNTHNVNFNLVTTFVSSDTIKKYKKTSKISRTIALLSPPSTTAGSTCGDGMNPSQVNVYAFSNNNSETIEWFASQTSASPIFTGNVYSPSIITTKTYYVRSRSGIDISTRVPVVASVYFAPPAVTLSASPANNTTSPLCLGTSVTFTASGGADLFEFSVDGVVMQTMSSSKMFTTSALTDGQVVRVRTRYAVSMDGVITEKTWGTGALEDNFLSAPLSANASTGYINSLKISSSEDKLVFGVAGKVLDNRSLLLFLDTKSGGFNISNYGDETNSDPLVRSFNIFNNNPSTFDSYFQADYCLVISTDAGETNYYANVIELKTGTSIKTYLGSAATGFPSSVMGVNKNNIGINDYNLGFEVEVLKSLIGYTTGDIKFFALTMNDKDDGSQMVTNSFLSPERTSSSDYGIGSIDYNLKDPNPVVVSSAALTPCYSEANIIMNFVSIPITASVVQPTCAVPSGSIAIATQPGVEYGLDGITYQASNTFTGLAPNNYTLYVRNKLDNSCVIASVAPITINAIPNPPIVPTAAIVMQATCGRPSGSISITTQSGTEYSLDGNSYQASNTFSGLAPADYTLFVRNIGDSTCLASSASTTTINALPTPPIVPTTASVVQPTCAVPSGSISITTQSGVEYSLNGTTYQASNSFTGLTPNNYTLYVRKIADNTCVTSSASGTTINALPTPPLAPTTASVVQPTCGTPSGSIAITTQSGVEYSLNGTTYQGSNAFTGLAPNNYTLYVRKIADNTCVTSSVSTTTINALPTPPIAPTTASVVQPTCGTPSGSITIATQTGVEYSLNGTTYQTSNSFTGLAPNNYTLYVRKIADNTCVTSSASETTINALPTPPIVPTAAIVMQPTCGTPSGSISITTQSGVEYSLNGTTYQGSNAFTGLAPNNYTLYVRNTADNTCVTSSASTTTINALPTPPIVPTTASVVQPTCGTPSGSITITTQSGVEYSLNGTTYQGSNAFTGLTPNNYTLYVRKIADNTCITSSASVTTINALPTPPIVPTTASVVQPTCGTLSGSIAITTQSGVEYSLNGTTYQASNSFTGLTPNNYTLYVRKIADNTCVTSSVSTTTINALPTPPIAPTTASVVQPTCGTPSGRITIATQTGVEYSLNGTTYQASNSFTGLTPNNYTLYVRKIADNTCVTSSASGTTINALPTPPIAPTTASVVQPTCGTPSGSITIATQTGVEYSLNGTIYQTSNSFTGLAPNNYTLYVRKIADNTCVTSSASETTINALPTPPIVPTAAIVMQPTCGTPSGSISITTQSGVEYSLNGTTYQGSNAFTGLAPNNYTLYVRNTADNTCVTSSASTTTINALPTPPIVPITASVVQPTCGTPSGSITITTQSGVEYSLNGTTYQGSNAFTGLTPNNYTLYVRKIADNTCITSSASVTTINALPTPPIVPTTASVVQPTCAVPSGSISITTQSGVEYSLNGTTYQASNSFTGLTPNNYTLYVRKIADNTCVTSSASGTTINALPTPPIAPTTASVVQPTCGTPSGRITIATQTGVEYSLNGTTYQTSNIFTGLAPNNYTLYVRKIADNTCVTSSVSTTTINALPIPPIAPTTASVVQPTCGTPSGSIVITTQTGMEYSLNGTTYQVSNAFTGLAPNNYTLYVRKIADNTCMTSSASVTTINAIKVVLVPTTSSVVQPTCGTPSGSISITTQTGVEYSLNGSSFQTSNVFIGLAPNNYTLYVRNTSDNTCVTSSASAITINPVPTSPIIPTMASAVQPTCAVPSGSIVMAPQSGVEYSLNGTTYQVSNIFTGLAPNNYTLYVRNTVDTTCSVQSVASVTINALPALPVIPTLAQINQPTCLEPMGRIQITPQANVQYSLGNGYQDNPEFLNLAPGKYTMSVRFANSIACITIGSEITINAIPPQIQFEISGDCASKDYVLTANAIASSYDSNNVDYEWRDSTGNPVGTNSNILNASDVIASTTMQEVFPVKYSLTVRSIATGCETTNTATLESIYCNMQKGISPDGNGSNDYFDLRLMDVKNLEIFDRYGIKVYNQTNYTDQWKGQSDKGNELPSATYYYVIQFNNGETKTGWIYLIREK
ncbi:gliding motility-associated C-terminal domain-containing protein [Flavobacterium sp. LB1P62]|uniref:T9SS type B sorting domain-containing protein n=1 Tax=Flavobacterium sp. LB1P62 TaxID=3401715 RepID=UPI003AAF4CE5